MFVTLPKVFAEMKIGNLIGAGFFILVLFAALTSSVSVMEAIVSGLDDRYHWGRKKATVICYIYAVALGICCSLGFGKWSSFTIFGFSILDFLDFVSNSLLMPVVGMLTCIMVGFVLKPQLIVNEIELNGPFKMKKFYSVMVKWIAPPCLLAILISSISLTISWGFSTKPTIMQVSIPTTGINRLLDTKSRKSKMEKPKIVKEDHLPKPKEQQMPNATAYI
jgi:NSS family neurotransmitter:Na+ symporter